MEQRIKAAAVTVVAMILLFVVSIVMTDAVYAADTIKPNNISEEEPQSKNIQNKTDTKEPVLNKLLSLMSSGGYTIKTNLKSGFTMRSSKKVFDVWAKKNGSKTDAAASLYRVDSAGDKKHVSDLGIGWDDGNKVSFIIDMSKQVSGDFVVEVSAGSRENKVTKEYAFTYEKTPDGGYIGDVVVDIEAFTISLGYIAEPTRVPVYEGETAAHVLDRFIKSLGYTYEATGGMAGGFYLGRINGLDVDFSKAKLEETVATKIDEDYWTGEAQIDGALGEFDFTDQSGWMYSVNNVFPNVGFSGYYLDAGDVMRVQFTLALGRDIGGSGSTGGWNPDWYAVADKDDLTDLLADINSAGNSQYIKDDQRAAHLIEEAMQLNTRIAATQDEVDEMYDELHAYLYNNGEDPSVELDKSELSILKGKDNSVKLEAAVGETASLKPQHLIWSSEDPMIATVDREGNVTGQSAGTTTITATVGNSRASCQVTVEEKPLTGIKILGNTNYETSPGVYEYSASLSVVFSIRPEPLDTTDDYTPKWGIDTRRYMTFTASGNRFHGLIKREGTTVITATVGDFSESVTVKGYENKVKDFSLKKSDYVNDDEIIFNINGESNVKNAVLAFSTDPADAQDWGSYTFASSDPNVFTVATNVASYQNDIKVRLYTHNDGVAELYVTIGNVIKTYPVTVNDLDGSNNIVVSDYSSLSQAYSADKAGHQVKTLGGTRYRAGKPYSGRIDKDKFIMAVSDPDLILGFAGQMDGNGLISGGHSYQSNDFVTTDITPYLTGETGTATVTNRMYDIDRVVSKIVVAEEVTLADSLTIKKDGDVAPDSDDYHLHDAFSLTASVSPEDATGEIAWYSSDADVAVVDQDGNVEAVGYGDAEIVACIAGEYDVYTIHVDNPMTGMVISNEELSLTTGTTRTLRAWCVPNDTSEDKTITWSSSDPDVVSVTESGRIKTLSEGTAVITAQAGSLPYIVTCTVTVDDSILRRLYFPRSPLYAEVGDTIHIDDPVTVPENAVTTDSDFTWSSSNEEKATVDQYGNVKILSVGPEDRHGLVGAEAVDISKQGVRIYVEKDGIVGECKIDIDCPATGIGISEEEITIVKGEEYELETLFYPEYATDERNAVNWVSSNPLVVSQREEASNQAWKRTITGLKLGEATITAYFGEFSATCKVKVTLPPAQQEAYDLQKKIEEWCDLDPVSDRAKYVSIGKEIMETWKTFTDAQKDLVGGYNEYFAEHVDEIRAMAEDDDAAAGAAALIEAIGKVSFDKSCKSRIDAARKAYDALTAVQKKLISADVLKVLTDAEQRYGELKKADEKKQEIARKKAAAGKLTVSKLKVKSKSRKFTISWKKNHKATGYQVQYRKKGAKKFTNLKKAVVKVKVKSKKLKKGKKYQFRVRTYTIVEGSKVYGKWTKVKTAKCK